MRVNSARQSDFSRRSTYDVYCVRISSSQQLVHIVDGFHASPTA
jgi:hypothetical protein